MTMYTALSEPTKAPTETTHRIPSKMRPLAPTHEATTTKIKLAEMLQQRSVSFVRNLNARDVRQPWTFASDDYVHRFTTPTGEIIDMTAEETMQYFYDKFEEYPDYQFEIVDTSVHMEQSEKPTYATVWQTVVVRNGGDPGERERVAIYSWRKETDKYGVANWVWWRQECPSTAALVPF